MADEQVTLLRRWGAPSAFGPALRLAGELRGTDGLEQLREAVDQLTPTGAALELARARLALGRRPELDPDEAVPLLRAAAAGARDCGARPELDAAVAALSDRGEQPESALNNRPSSVRLTGRERQVLDLSAAGLDVHQVAARLFLTPSRVHQVLADAAGKTRGVDDALK